MSQSGSPTTLDAAHPDKKLVCVQCLRIDKRSVCVLPNERDFIPLSCFLEWCSTTEDEVIAMFEDCGLGMPMLTIIDGEIWHSIKGTPHLSNKSLATDSYITYLRILE